MGQFFHKTKSEIYVDILIKIAFMIFNKQFNVCFTLNFGKDPKFKSEVSIFREISSVNAYCFISFDLHYFH